MGPKGKSKASFNQAKLARETGTLTVSINKMNVKIQLLKEETTASIQSLSDRFRKLSAEEKEFAGELVKLRMEAVQIDKMKESLVSFERRLETAQKSTDEIRKRLNDLEIEEALPDGEEEGLRKERLAE